MKALWRNASKSQVSFIVPQGSAVRSLRLKTIQLILNFATKAKSNHVLGRYPLNLTSLIQRTNHSLRLITLMIAKLALPQQKTLWSLKSMALIKSIFNWM